MLDRHSMQYRVVESQYLFPEKLHEASLVQGVSHSWYELQIWDGSPQSVSVRHSTQARRPGWQNGALPGQSALDRHSMQTPRPV